jgi:CSLREA domain-containing protein
MPRIPCILLLASLLTLGMAPIKPLYAATIITVTTFNDELNADGDCSLREAIRAANLDVGVDACPAGSADDSIRLSAGTYTLAIAGQSEDAALTGDLDLSGAGHLAIQGAGASATIVDGGDIDRVFDIVGATSSAALSNLTIQNGQVPSGQGSGGIRNVGTLTLDRAIIQHNRANGSTASDIGGGICNGCGPGTGTLTLINSIVSGNTAERGGGIFSNATLIITGSSIISNTARSGGGLMNYASISGGATLTNSTISGNIATNGIGGISQETGAISITNSTISGNSGTVVGGFYHGEGTSTLRNTIIANNDPGTDCLLSSPITSGGHNLSSDSTCGFTAGGDLQNANPLLGPLANNGGPTPTHALLLGSPAFDAGPNTGCPATDQRGITRPQGIRCDIGAFERVVLTVFMPLVQR